ncbi:MAG: adenylate kinase [Clostridia bacterium]|nr:adenylate kinase [Clostridia bacterium]
MKRIMIIGCPGSGKSTLARALAAKTRLPLYCLDMMYWNPDRTTKPKEEFRAALRETVKLPEWIIDGNYGSTLELRMEACDTIIFLDYPLEVCLSGVEERRGKPRADMPWVETEPDLEFIEFIKKFNEESKPKIVGLLEQYKNKNIIVFTSRADADEYLRRLS